MVFFIEQELFIRYAEPVKGLRGHQGRYVEGRDKRRRLEALRLVGAGLALAGAYYMAPTSVHGPERSADS
jgi:hypothetical protein